ncbi:hypothetical protein, partial [Leptospira bandrabouensis]|uniref:hypothetical protein n=1 Tax=Leptospira bandrabouensis TaxID=2484903 RepID=UPI001FCC1812
PVDNFPNINDLEEINPYDLMIERDKKGSKGKETSFKNEIEYENYLKSIGKGGNSKYLDPYIWGEIAKGKLTGNYSHYEESDQSKAFKHGAVQGATFNFGDELEGRAKQFLDGANYETARDSARAENQRLQEVSPNAYMAGEITGSLAVPGMGAGKLGTRIASGMAQGGLDAYGRNENPDDLISDVGTGIAIGGAVPLAFEGLGEGVKRLNSLMPKAETIKKAGFVVANNTKNRALGLLFDMPEDSIDEILKNPEKVKNALSLQEIGERIPESISILNKEISSLDGKAWDLLDETKQFGHSNKKLEGIIDGIQNNLMTETKQGLIPIGLAEEKAYLKLDQIKEKINQYDDVLSERQVKKLIQSLDNDIDWERIDNSLPDQMVRDLRFQFDDLLKQNNTAYAEAMKPVSTLTDLSQYIKSQFGIKKGQGGVDGLVASDLTLSKLNNTLNDRKAFTQDKLKEFGRITGQDILDETKYSKLANSLDSTTTQGSRKTNMGALALGGVGTAIGSMVGSPAVGGAIGGAVGGAVGYTLDKYGRKMGKKLLLEGGNPNQYVSKFRGTKYFKPLSESLKRGNKSLAVTHYLLSKTDPEFRQMDSEEE